jgi:hypothetical protein
MDIGAADVRGQAGSFRIGHAASGAWCLIAKNTIKIFMLILANKRWLSRLYLAGAEPDPGLSVKAWQSWPELRRTTAEGRFRDLKPISRQP